MIDPTVELSRLHWFAWCLDEAKILLSRVTKMRQQVQPDFSFVLEIHFGDILNYIWKNLYLF